MVKEIDFSKIERKWQDRWEKKKIFESKIDKKKKKFYVLDMFPYPSGAGLHMGHAFVYSLGDIFARYKRMQGFNVLYPIGYDSLGLPAENAAIKVGIPPSKYTENSIKNFMRQQKAMGWSYDWTRMLKTSDSSYYRWDQWIFLKMLEKGIAYRKKAPVNWCPECQTVLANEQVHDGKCWRHEDTNVEIKHLEQWFFRITDYADELIKGLEKVDWPERAKIMQRNWIGKSHGIEINFEIENRKKIILVDAVQCLVDKERKVNRELKNYLDSIDNRKIVLTNALANDDLFKNIRDYEIFSLENKPDKKSPDYYNQVLKKFNLDADDVIYFEHNKESVESARSIGINTFLYQNNIEDVKRFISRNLGENWPIFTTRPDTIYGVTFMVISAQHPKLMEIVTDKQKPEVERFLKRIKSVSEKEMEDLEKEGVFTGSYAKNPLNGEEIPVWAGNFVLAEYGSGMVMAVPAHDQRDYEFAKKYGIPIKIVINPREKELSVRSMEKAYTDEGVLVASDKFDGTDSKQAIEKISNYIEKKKLGKKTTQYKLRDWLISRQRYWGTPIPIIYCDKCGIVPVPEKDLPVQLPDKVKFGKGNPLATAEKWIRVKCPRCGGVGRRETDTMDTFVNSSWYYLRYADSKNNKAIFDKKKANYWCPIDQYIGGPEHITAHLIYTRFYTKFLRDLGLLKFDEPALRYFTQGIVHGSDGEKMSKSRGNVVEPLSIIERYGADSLRLALISFATPDKDSNWDEKILIGGHKFLAKLYNYFDNFKPKKAEKRVESRLNKNIKEVAENIENFKYNIAIIRLRELFDYFSEKDVDKNTAEQFLKMFSVFCPHICEELWSKMGKKGFISLEKWPKYDEKKIDLKLEVQEKQVDKLTDDIRNILRILEGKGKKGREIKVFAIPNEVRLYKENTKSIEKSVGLPIEVFSIKDAKKEEKAVKAKPGKPGILVE